MVGRKGQWWPGDVLPREGVGEKQRRKEEVKERRKKERRKISHVEEKRNDRKDLFI